MTIKEDGAQGFSKDYWDKNYSTPDDMDGIGNASEHILYLKNLFAIEYIDISSIIDFGFGKAKILEEALNVFKPYRAVGIEPSKFIFDEVKANDICKIESTKFNLYNTDILSFLNKSKKIKRFDLGFCTSVFQYLSDEELELVVPLMAQSVKYLYLSVPTDKELKRQVNDLEFHDEYAILRSRTKYQKLLRKYFTFISCRVLESKIHFNEDDTFFTDLLFRF